MDDLSDEKDENDEVHQTKIVKPIAKGNPSKRASDGVHDQKEHASSLLHHDAIGRRGGAFAARLCLKKI